MAAAFDSMCKLHPALEAISLHVHEDHAKQVRQSLYFSSVGKWKQYADPMEEIAHRLQNIIKPFEQELAKYERSQPVLVDNGQEYDKIAQSSDEL